MSTMPPVFGPTEISGDNDLVPHAIVHIALALPYKQLRAALAISHAQLAGEPPLEDMSVDDLRREVEGYLAACALVDLDRDAAASNLTDPVRLAELDAAVDRAYTMPPRPPVQDPRYGEGTVTLQTLDHGEVTLPEPSWCRGHGTQLVGSLDEVTHEGLPLVATVGTAAGEVELLSVNLTHAPYLRQQPEPYPVAHLEGVESSDVDAVELRMAAARLVVYTGRLRDLARELDELRGGATS